MHKGDKHCVCVLGPVHCNINEHFNLTLYLALTQMRVQKANEEGNARIGGVKEKKALEKAREYCLS